MMEATERQILDVEQQLNMLLVNNPEHFLVDIKILPGNNIKVFIDADNGVSISDLVNYNRILFKAIESSGIFPNNDFSLEVSSPGLDQPLRMKRQYTKNLGRYIDVALNDGTSKQGKLMETTEDGLIIELETGKGKKKIVRQETILFENIKKTKIQIKF